MKDPNRCKHCWSDEYVTNGECPECQFISVIEELTGLIWVGRTDLSDMSKDAYGFRYRGYKSWWTEQELQAEYDSLQRYMEIEAAEEAELQQAEDEANEAAIQTAINMGAGDRETAIRWLAQA